VDKAVNDKLQEMQLKLENTMLEKKKVAEVSVFKSYIFFIKHNQLGIIDVFALSCR
jgi:hypothetical protein